MAESRPLRVFLCHASQDKPAVRELYRRLQAGDWLDPWLDEERLLPGQDWEIEIYKAIREADAIIVCLSKESVAKEGYVQKEFKRALNFAEEKPEGTIYIIPLRLDECTPPMKFRQWQWVNYFDRGAHDKLLEALRLRFDGLQPKPKAEAPKPAAPEIPAAADEDLDLYRFIEIPPTSEVPYSFWIGKYPVTNAQYARFLDAPDYAAKEYWCGFLKFDEDLRYVGHWGDEGLQFLNRARKLKSYSPDGEHVEPRFWEDKLFGICLPNNPVVAITWYEANAYCLWLYKHWLEMPESHANSLMHPRLLRLPVEYEWVSAARGENPDVRFPRDITGEVTTKVSEVLRRANVMESDIGHTTPVNTYPEGASPFGVMDMAGNVWEWQANYSKNKFAGENAMALCGGSWGFPSISACVGFMFCGHPSDGNGFIGFRVVALPK